MIIAIILACEILFWVAILAGLSTRYLLNMPRLGAGLLICVPIIDLILLAATAVDLHNGATATVGHGLAAGYLGCSLGFGRRTIQWADERFAHRFAGGPAPTPTPKYGKDRVRYEAALWVNFLVAWFVSVGLLQLLIWLVGDVARTETLSAFVRLYTIIFVVETIYALSWKVWPRQRTQAESTHSS
ncbi:hypothetical protein D3M95_09295 [Corynebacterium falsenii]|uniref:Uncharacterized protein n=1 Tax=Corynebacterium falsenii TaxID=108486 RepID=A0A418Q5J1_9CORY|nr:hypothetical protein [Corynebacterium falsenii]RIX33878.1 hypothetical protein D3M95_09295 [Corynebacterium falsenii]